MRQPSDILLRRLLQQKLCTRTEIDRCEPIVRRLCHELPDFDCVWLDALVQNRVLTPWQADRLQSDSADHLQVGSYLLRDRIGPHTYVAESPGSTTLVVLEQLPDNEHLASSRHLTLTQLLEQIHKEESHVPAGITIPSHIVGDEDSARFAASTFIAGWTADELLIRGGRIPWQVVAEVGAQLLQGLSWLESHGASHGDITLGNLRITTSGDATLVAPFVKRLRTPIVSYSSTLQYRDVETLAPELVGSGATHDERSDLYSLGCLLWQLLTARPPILTTDPVNKVVKSQTQDIPDVRSIVPDCPEQMARAIAAFTRRSPELRPASISVAAEKWPQPSRKTNRFGRRLIQRMPDRRQTQRLSGRTSSWKQRIVPAATLLVLVGCFTAWGFHRGLIPRTLMMAAPAEQKLEVDAQPPLLAESSIDPDPTGPIPLPQPDAAGVVVLESGRIYLADTIEFAGDVYIESTTKEGAVVRIDSSATWQLTARQIVMSGVRIETATPDGETPTHPVSIAAHCDVLSISNCILNSVADSPTASCLLWKSRSSDPGVLQISNSILNSSGYGLRLQSPPKRMSLENVLLATAASAVRCDVSNSTGSHVTMKLDRLTQRVGHSFLDIVATSTDTHDIRCEIICGESVLAPQTALVRIAGPEQWSRSGTRIDFLLPERGNPTIVPPNTEIAVALDRSLNSLVALNEDMLTTDSLLIAEPAFQGDVESVSGCVVVDYEGPKLNATMPGIEAELLPAPTQSSAADMTHSDFVETIE